MKELRKADGEIGSWGTVWESVLKAAVVFAMLAALAGCRIGSSFDFPNQALPLTIWAEMGA